MVNIGSELVFERYEVERILYSNNPSYIDSKDPVNLNYNIEVAISVNEQISTKYKVSLECKIFEEAKTKNYPFSIEVVGSGYFDCIRVDKEIVNSLIQINAVSILLPYLRATIASITALTGNPALNLPLINVQKLLLVSNTQLQEQKQEQLTESKKASG